MFSRFYSLLPPTSFLLHLILCAPLSLPGTVPAPHHSILFFNIELPNREYHINYCTYLYTDVNPLDIVYNLSVRISPSDGVGFCQNTSLAVRIRNYRAILPRAFRINMHALWLKFIKATR